MSILHIDFETYSRADLKSVGLDNYARHPSTGVHCMAFVFDDEPVEIWVAGQPIPPRIERHVRAGGRVYAHNVNFELLMWNCVMRHRHGWPPLHVEQVRCTMAMCYAMGLPGKLEDAAPALGIAQRKDVMGARVMMVLCRPNRDGKLWTPDMDPERFARLYAYCKQDVEVERAVHKRLMELDPIEQRLWVLDHRINQRGVKVDLPAIDKALALVADEQKRLNQEMLRVTGGVVGKCTEVALLVKWIRSQGVEIEGVAKAAVLDALEGDLPEPVRRALELRKEAAKSSTAKLVAMKERAGPDGRVRSIHQYHGAATGRWAGRGIQTQNMTRPRPSTTQKDIDVMFEHLEQKDYIDAFYGPTMDAVVDCLRGMLIPEQGRDFIAMDFSAVEARVLAWLAGEEHVLETFRRKEDIYKAAAGRIYRVAAKDVDKQQRQIGKVATLALGYQGGVGAFQSMAKNYAVKVKDADADEIKLAWRAAHPKIVSYWYELEAAAIRAVVEGGTQLAGPKGRQIAYRKKGSFLWCRLPSGRVLCYPYPEIRTITTPWGEEKEALTYMTQVSNPKAKIVEDENASGSWKRVATYGGSLAENVTQAVARDLLRDAMFRQEDAGFEVVMHVHDETVVEVASSCDDHTLSRVEALMAEVPAWATGLPLAAEGWRGRRYRK